MEKQVIIIGSGAGGLSAAWELAKQNIKVILVSDMPSERSQSVMAEGGINAALNLENDLPAFHAEETLKAGRYIASFQAVHNMTEEAPEIIKKLFAAGMSFSLDEDKKIALRAFGGQKQKRTAYAASNTGKQLMYTLIQQVRQYEAEGKVTRYTGWYFLKLIQHDQKVYGCILYHPWKNELKYVSGSGIIIASGGLNGVFGNATGSVKNTGYVTASLFEEGVPVANGEFIQFHPTTVKLQNKNMLITEAVRGEGGRLFILKNQKPEYFMEEKYPELGNLMPRDVISREEWRLMQQGCEIFLDMRGMDEEIYSKKLKGVIQDCRQFLGLDPVKEPIPVRPGIHYFMGGIYVDVMHRTNFKGLYAAGECACQYHGANRLGGNSLLGALYGGKTAALSAVEDLGKEISDDHFEPDEKLLLLKTYLPEHAGGNYISGMKKLHQLMQEAMGIVRDEITLTRALESLDDLIGQTETCYDEKASLVENLTLKSSLKLSKAILTGALKRKESRGAHWRSDYPEEAEEFRKTTVARYINGKIEITFEDVEEERS